MSDCFCLRGGTRVSSLQPPDVGLPRCRRVAHGQSASCLLYSRRATKYRTSREVGSGAALHRTNCREGPNSDIAKAVNYHS